MRNVIMLNRVSIDGFFAGPHGEIDWFIPDPEVDKMVHGAAADTVLFGRVTYELFEKHWPKAAVDPKTPEGERQMANELNQMTKVVFSRTLKKVTWEKSRLVRGDVAEEVRRLKQAKGSGIIIFGSGTIVQQLASEGLIDDYWFVLTPVILGAGKQLFTGVKKTHLELVEAKSFKSRNVVLHYRPTNPEKQRT